MVQTGYIVRSRANVGPLGLITRNKTNKVTRRPRRGRSLKQMHLAMLFAALFLMTGTMALAQRNGAAHSTFPTQVPVIVQRGDTLWKLAHRYGDPHRYILERVDELANENDLSSDTVLQPGQRVFVPVHSESDYTRILAKMQS